MKVPSVISLPEPVDIVLRMLAQAQGLQPLELLMRLVRDEAKRTDSGLDPLMDRQLNLFKEVKNG